MVFVHPPSRGLAQLDSKWKYVRQGGSPDGTKEVTYVLNAEELVGYFAANKFDATC